MDSEIALLYELICCAEWTEDKEELTPFQSLSTCESGVLSYLKPATLFRKKPLTPSETALWLKSVGPSWQYAVASDGKIIAVLQDTILETRSSRDNFSSVLGKTHVTNDEFPNFRRLVWSRDSSLLAISFTNGLISCFDIMASQMFSVRRFENEDSLDDGSKLVCSMDKVLVGMFFVEERLKKTIYCSELLTVDKRGIIKSFRQTNPDEIKFHHEGSLRQYYSFGVTDAQYSDSHGIILVSGSLLQESHTEQANVHHGITAWRLLLDHPYYRILFTVDVEEFRMDARRLWKMAFTLTTAKQQQQESVVKMVLSPSNSQLAAIHVSGAISIWKIPSLKLSFMWPLKSQFQYNVANSRFNYRWRSAFNQSQLRTVDHLMFHPYDINWWDEENIIISRTNGSVTLVPICDCPCNNLLGDVPEQFESPVRISTRFEKSFFVLEAEVRHKGNHEVSEHNDSWIKSATQEILFWLTDIERFRPPRKRKKKLPCWTHTHRIFTLRNITPQELFYRRIEQEEYGEALDLAKLYKLDPDLVFQRQWTRNPVSIHTIKDFLAKITKRNWVLQECLDRVPDSIDAARELLKFGLKGTDITVAVLISQGKDKGKFIFWTPDDLDLAKEEYLSLVDQNNAEVIRLLRYRKRFLYFMDILDTYEEIIGGARMVEDRYDSKAYGRLRSRSTIESAVEMAQSCDINGLRILLTNHWDDISAHYLDILSSFPEPWSPHDYKEFLPSISEDDDVILWKDVAVKEEDWCEKFLPKSDSVLNETRIQKDPTPEDVYRWYERRIREIEGLSGMINHALDLGLLGAERNVVELQSLVQDLHTLETMVYEVQLEDMTLSKLKSLTDFERIVLLMSKSTDETLVSDFRFYVLPFLANCEDRLVGSSFKLTNEYLTSICSTDLGMVLKIFEASKEDEFDPLISDAKELMLLAHNCIYHCENTHQTENVLAILACLPARSYVKKSQSVEKLHCLIDDVESHFKAVQVLQKYHVTLTVDKVKQISKDGNPASVEELLTSICRSASKIYPSLKVNDWKTLLTDILEIRNNLFKTFEIEKCFEIYFIALLRSGSAEVIKLAKDFVEKNPPTLLEPSEKPNPNTTAEYSPTFSIYIHVIAYFKGLDMIIDAAQMYFDSSSSYADPDMELCKVCLNLIQNPREPKVSYLFDLLDAVKLINKDFSFNILPHAVRICEDKVDLIRQTMEKSKIGYKKIQQLLKLVVLLHVEGMSLEEAESIVLEMAGDAAFADGDLRHGMQICHSIMAKQYNKGWQIFTSLAKDESDPPLMNTETSMAFINYALSICPDSEILTVLNAKYLTEIRFLQTRLMELTPSESSPIDTAILENQKDESVVHQKLNRIQLQEFLKTTTRWIKPLTEMAEAVKVQGSKLTRLRSQSGDSSLGAITQLMMNQGFEKEAYPAFQLCEEDSSQIHRSNLSYQYNSFAAPSTTTSNASNPALEHCIILNRIWHLEQLILGPVDAASRDLRVLQQLVLEILPEDIPWGLAILFSIDDIYSEEYIPRILSKLPKTIVSVLVCLYFLALRIQMNVLGLKSISDDNLCLRNPNRVISQTSELLEGGDPETDGNERTLSLFCRLFWEYDEHLNEFKN